MTRADKPLPPTAAICPLQHAVLQGTAAHRHRARQRLRNGARQIARQDVTQHFNTQPDSLQLRTGHFVNLRV
ncbi:MAG: hypothetical protein AAF993_14590 [Pseudomonadota bacterium]